MALQQRIKNMCSGKETEAELRAVIMSISDYNLPIGVFVNTKTWKPHDVKLLCMSLDKNVLVKAKDIDAKSSIGKFRMVGNILLVILGSFVTIASSIGLGEVSQTKSKNWVDYYNIFAFLNNLTVGLHTINHAIGEVVHDYRTQKETRTLVDTRIRATMKNPKDKINLTLKQAEELQLLCSKTRTGDIRPKIYALGITNPLAYMDAEGNMYSKDELCRMYGL